ncbi:hypothetical protein F4X86_00545 [Candidatus Saccharibacteria bacterium]|nr:hypothetical protein [Candidatus Saccharibacteria bacterium]
MSSNSDQQSAALEKELKSWRGFLLWLGFTVLIAIITVTEFQFGYMSEFRTLFRGFVLGMTLTTLFQKWQVYCLAKKQAAKLF